MRKQKHDKTGGGEPPEGGTGNAAASLVVEVEKVSVYTPFDATPLAGQVFYVLDRDLSEILKENRDTIWRDLLKKKSPFVEGARGEYIKEILSLPDNPRKYPAALILTADKLSRMTPVINAGYTKAIDVLRIQGVKNFYNRLGRKSRNRRPESKNILCLRCGRDKQGKAGSGTYG